MKDRLIAGAILLVIYPFVAMASLMSLASPATGTEPVALLAVARGFQLTSLLYPVVYLGSLFAALALKKKNESIAAKLAINAGDAEPACARRNPRSWRLDPKRSMGLDEDPRG